MTRGKSFGIGVLAASIILLASFTVQASDPQLSDNAKKLFEGVAVVRSEAGLPPITVNMELTEKSQDYIDNLHNNGIVVDSYTAPQKIILDEFECLALLYRNSEGATPEAAINDWLSRSATYAIMAEKGPYEGSYDAIGVAIAHEYALVVFA